MMKEKKKYERILNSSQHDKSLAKMNENGDEHTQEALFFKMMKIL